MTIMKNQKIIIVLSRFIGYIGVSMASLIFPILVYNITNSKFYSGLIMLTEWIPKLYIYLTGGQLINKINPKKAYVLMDLSRALTFVLFFGAIYFKSIVFLFLAAPLSQSSNAISNIIFESLISCWWAENKKILGHTTLMYMDLLAGVSIVPLLFYFKLEYIVVLGFFLFLLSFIIGVLNKHKHLLPLHIDYVKTNLFDNVKEIFANKKLIGLSLLGFAMSSPIALISSQLPFFISNFEKELANSASFLSGYKAILAMFSIVFLLIIRDIKNKKIIFNVSISLMFLSLTIILLNKNIYIFLFLFLFSSFGFYSYTIFAKDLRQNLIPKEKRLEFTGILISIEAFSYILSALLMMIFYNNLNYAIVFCLLILSLALFVFVWYNKKLVRISF